MKHAMTRAERRAFVSGVLAGAGAISSGTNSATVFAAQLVDAWQLGLHEIKAFGDRAETEIRNILLNADRSS